jgi:hypothetical protein
MCCFTVVTPLGFIAKLFTKPVHVSKTNIFARRTAENRQVLAYGMNLESSVEMAMVLPLPVAFGSGEDAVRFIDLSATPRMFEDLASLFAIEMFAQRKGGFRLNLSIPKKLVVHDVGAFVASYVPTREDFSRLDERFRLPSALFDAVPHYHDYGFAVFQLKPGKVTVHPMAFEFPTRSPEKIFFPTVHVHDGRFHATAKFDHALYYQHPRVPEPRFGGGTFGSDEVSWIAPSKSYAGIVDEKKALVRRKMRARSANEDTWIPAQ